MPLLLQLLFTVLQLLCQQLYSSFPGSCRLLKECDLQVLGMGQSAGLSQPSLCCLQCVLQLVVVELLALQGALYTA